MSSTKVNNIFGMIMLISFVGIFISLFVFQHVRIGLHVFNIPLLLFLLILIVSFINIVLKPFLKEKDKSKTNSLSGIKYWLTIGLFILIISIVGYFGLYLPLQSVYLTEFNFQDTNSVKINAKEGMQIYFEIDSETNTNDGTELEIILNGNLFSASVNTLIGEKTISDKLEGKTTITVNKLVFVKEKIPADAEYLITVKKISGDVIITNIRVYAQNSK